MIFNRNKKRDEQHNSAVVLPSAENVFSDFIKIISTKIDIKENVSKRQRIINCSRILFPRLL